MKVSTLFLMFAIQFSAATFAETKPVDLKTETIYETCLRRISELPSLALSTGEKQKLCEKAATIPECRSVQNEAIFHFDQESLEPKGGAALAPQPSGKGTEKDPEITPKDRRILVFALIHGDELVSGSIATKWVQRLTLIGTRSRWRVIPILNPDGLTAKTRTNARGVDVNRNFPSKDWDELALKKWSVSKDPRRYPGPTAASEPETLCAMKHITEYKPDFIVAVHTPYGVLDFDGPTTIKFPKYTGLSWTSLGTFPGSLGRYLWKDQNIPVLTIELKDGEILKSIDEVHRLQDISGSVAIQSL